MGLLNFHNALILFAAAIVGGIINSVAGGGSFVTFPTLLLTGVPPIQANATNTLALIPGAIASAAAYHREYAREPWQTIVPLVGTGVVGSLMGAMVLLHTPQQTFLRLIPYLLGGATILFMVSVRITRWVRGHTGHHGGKRTLWGWIWTLSLAMCIAVYIGYFGAGAGILTLALLALIGIESIHTMNAYKALLVGIGNTIAMVAFVAAGMIYWAQAGIMLVGAMLGGYMGGYLALKMDPKYTRYAVIATGWALTLYFFGKYGF
ncbi:MAG: sulfite exporter TauE/SafE family protein [Candidatus Korobacteraceae bacterium]|jgi:uncharacterized membrane protein YfcA